MWQSAHAALPSGHRSAQGCSLLDAQPAFVSHPQIRVQAAHIGAQLAYWARLTRNDARTGRAGRSVTDNTNSNLLWPEDLIEQATRIIMDRFDLDAVHALELLRRMSRNTRTQMCVVAEQVINHGVPVEAVRHFEDVLGFG